MASSLRCALSLCLALAATACQRVPLTGVSSSSGGGGGGTDTDGDTDDSGGGTTGLPAGDPVYECDPVQQDCAGQDDKCTPVLSGGKQNLYTCVPDSGGLGLFDACVAEPVTGVDGCDPGLVCLEGVNDVGICVGLCVDDGDCSLALCLEDPRELVPFCALECDPFDSLCGNTLQCRRAQDRFACQFPEEGDDGFILDPCDPGTDEGCGSGVVCMQGALIPGCESSGCCTPVCDVTDPGSQATCEGVLETPAATCFELFDPPAPGFESYGVCVVPT